MCVFRYSLSWLLYSGSESKGRLVSKVGVKRAESYWTDLPGFAMTRLRRPSANFSAFAACEKKSERESESVSANTKWKHGK